MALAASGDAQANKLADQALLEDYLNLRLDDAVGKLEQALELCGESNCSPEVKARVHRDLGVVLIAGMQKETEGTEQFVSALSISPGIDLDPDLSTPEVEAAWEQAREVAGAGPSPAVADEEPEEEAIAVASGDIDHTPAEEQAVLTPVPVFVGLPAGAKPKEVRVLYRPFGVEEWKGLSLRKHKNGYGGHIPCLDVGSTTGDLRYIIEVVDRAGEVVANVGTKDAPIKVPIRTELEGDPPHLPGKPPPAQCQDATDCPPGLLGCEASEDFWGEDGEEEDEDSGDSVLNWLTLSAQMDIMFLPAAQGVCSENPPARYECFYSDGTHRQVGSPVDADENFANPGGNAGELASGFIPATMRVMLGFDRVVGGNLAIGGKLGFAFNGGPQASDPGAAKFLPVHVEANGAYYFGKDPFAKAGARFYLKGGVGMAQVDGHLNVEIQEQFETGGVVTPATDSNGQPVFSTVEVWKKSGNIFVAGGPGFMYAITPNGGPFLELRGMGLFPDNGIAIGAQLGYGIGF